MGNNNLKQLEQEYLELKPTLSLEAQELYEKVFQLLLNERQSKNQYRREMAMLMGIPMDNYSNKIDPEN